MPLTPGTRLAHYSIVSAIGAGGMGEVYLAEDTRLHRRVALKVLRTDLAVDETGEKRLLREARAAATLEHPNICIVYEVGEADGRGFIAMQYAEGDNLAERLKRGPIDLPIAIAIARQIAEALAEAHRLGIVHRDIKPQNLIVSQTNRVTVLDFGLAKPLGPDVSAALKTATALSAAGIVSGTVAYMSPEQARGEAVDARSDVFSFGIVLHEMIARAHPFAQGTWADTLAAILGSDPRPIDVPLPAELRRIIRKCLDKDRSRRYQTMRDAAIDLENLAQEISSTARSDSPAAADEAQFHRRRRVWIAAATIVIAAAGAAALIWSGQPPAPLQAQFEPITDFTDVATAPSLSPDGRMVTFIRGGSWFLSPMGQIYVKMLPNGDAVRVTDDSRPKYGPVFSADGTRIAYTALTTTTAGTSWDTWTVPVSGGTPARLLANAAGLSWIDAGHILFSEIEPGSALHMGLVTSTEDRRDERRIFFPPHERGMVHFSYLSPDRQRVLAAVMGRLGTFERCRLLPFDGSGPGTEVGPEGECRSAAWSADGRWMYFTVASGGVSHLWRQRFPDGTPEAITSGPTTEEEGVAAAPVGRSLVTSIGTRQGSLWLYSNGGQRLLSSEGFGSAPMLSPDGRRMYYVLRRGTAPPVSELRVMDLASQKSERLLPDFSVMDYDISRDEQEVALTTRAADGSLEVWTARLDRRTAPARVAQGADGVAFAADHTLVFRSLEGHINQVYRIGLDGKNRVRLSGANAVDRLRTSPDGRWVAFPASVGADRTGVLAVPVDGGEAKLICSGMCEAIWAPDGSSLHVAFGLELPRKIVIVPLKNGSSFPDFPAGPDPAVLAWAKLSGAQSVQRMESVPGSGPSTFIGQTIDARQNLFRVTLPQ